MSALGGMALNLAGNAANQAISQWINYGFQKKLMGKQYEYNEKAAENAYERQLDFWDMQNKYDDVGSQMLRLRNAGLNPGLVNGQLGGQSNNLSSVSSASVGSAPSGPAPGKFDVMQIMMQDEQMKNLAADTAVKRENAEHQRMLNKQEAIRTNDFESYYQLLKDELTNRKNLSAAQEEYYREQAMKSFQEARLAAVAADNAEGAAAEGINPVIDTHNESVQRVMESFNRMINDNIRLDNENQLLPFTKQLLSGQITHIKQQNISQLLHNDMEVTKKTIRDTLAIDYDALPDYMKSATLSYITSYQLHQKGVIPDEDWQLIEDHFTEALSIYQLSGQNANNPDYVSVNQGTDNEKWKMEYKNKAVQNAIDISDILAKVLVGYMGSK